MGQMVVFSQCHYNLSMWPVPKHWVLLKELLCVLQRPSPLIYSPIRPHPSPPPKAHQQSLSAGVTLACLGSLLRKCQRQFRCELGCKARWLQHPQCQNHRTAIKIAALECLGHFITSRYPKSSMRGR